MGIRFYKTGDGRVAILKSDSEETRRPLSDGKLLTRLKIVNQNYRRRRGFRKIP